MSSAAIEALAQMPGAFRPLEDFDIVVVPGFLQNVLKADASAVLSSLQKEYAIRRAGQRIIPHTVQWVEGSNEALRYRGNVLNRTKIWLQRGKPSAEGIPYYYYTGVQWEVVLAQASWDECPEIENLIPRLDRAYATIGAKPASQLIVTAYNDETCGIGAHYDKPKSIAASDEDGASLITVVKIGDVGRPFELYRLAEEGGPPAWSGVVPPGAAIIMTLEANLRTKHAVPTLTTVCGKSGSLVWRTIRPESVFSLNEVQKKVEASRRAKKRSRGA